MDFDAQAEDFDHRTGLGQDLGSAVARALRVLLPQGQDTTALELGAGTGEIGCHITAWADRYLAMDTSMPMLARFTARQPGCHALLLQADANQPWPISSGCIDLVFASRALHLLDQEHLLAQLTRVANTRGVYLINGRVEREDGGVRDTLRQLMHAQLEALGLPPRRAKANWHALKTLCCKHGARGIESARVGHWRGYYRPNDMLTAWSAKSGLAGHVLGQAEQTRVMTALRREAEQHIGDLDRVITMEQSYRLQGLYFPAETLMQ